MNRRILVEQRRVYATLGGLLVFVLVLGGLVGCGGLQDADDAPDIPASPEEAGEVVVRVSGTEGITYEGNYGPLTQRPQIVEGEILGDEPTDYEVEIEDDSGGLTANFRKTQPGAGGLKVGILADGETVVESTTYAELGYVTVDWLPQLEELNGGIPPVEEKRAPVEEK